MEGQARLTPISRLMPSAPFPYGMKKEDHDRHLFGDISTFREIKTESNIHPFREIKTESNINPFSDRKSGFRFESLATEFEHMDDNDSGIGAFKFMIIIYEKQVLQLFTLSLSILREATGQGYN